MPRLKRTVKHILSPGLVDIHFHGAFGIDLMTAESAALTLLARKLYEHGIAAFCPTTLSATRSDLIATVRRLGLWIAQIQKDFASRRNLEGIALPLGIHLEGPFINPKAAGAHPADVIRPLTIKELEELWIASHKTLKLITFAPETLTTKDLKALCVWAKKKSVVLSLGHSQATQAQAEQAFALGVQGITHAWNALPFHHRAPGPLGAIIGMKNKYIELIPDLKHVDPTLIRWTLALHGANPVCFVSDCAPAAATPEGWHPFGPLQTTLQNGACRLPNGALAGGGLLLVESYLQWLKQEAHFKKEPILNLLKKTLPTVTTAPLAALGYSPERLLKFRLRRQSRLQIQWIPKGKFHLTCSTRSG